MMSALVRNDGASMVFMHAETLIIRLVNRE